MKIKRILVVEDDLSSEALWVAILGRLECLTRLDWATCVSEAEQNILRAEQQGQAYDLIIADIFLCGSRTGLDLWRSLKERFQGKVILVSGVNTDRISTYLEEPADPPLYLKKPLAIRDALEAVRLCLESSPQAPVSAFTKGRQILSSEKNTT